MPSCVAKRASILIGLRKVPDNYGATPGLVNFFRDVCDDQGDETTEDYKLSFDLIDRLQSGCWAHSADLTIMHSDRNCFDTAMILTFADAGNKLPLLPVTDAEWKYLVAKIPKGGKAVTPAAKVDDPCAPTVTTPAPNPCVLPPPPPSHYAHLIQDRVCIAMPDLKCSNNCGKECSLLTPKTLTTTTVPACTSCYDCEFDEIWYAFFGTIIAFWLCQTTYKCTQDKSFFWFWAEKTSADYSPLNPVFVTGKVSPNYWQHAMFSFAVMSLFYSVLAYYFVNFMNYCVVVLSMKKEMCVKVWDWQSNLDSAMAGWQKAITFSLSHGDRSMSCVNDACPLRMWGMIIVTWLSLSALFSYWRFYMSLETVQTECKRVETVIEVGNGASMSGAGNCAVQ